MSPEKKEVWRDIANVNSYYQVSNRGNIRKLIGKEKRGKLVYKPIKTYEKGKTGIMTVTLEDVDGFGHRASYSVPFLVAEAFLQKSKPQWAYKARTINGNKPSVDNVEWLHTTAKRKEGSRYVFIEDGKEKGIYNSIKEMAISQNRSFLQLKGLLLGTIKAKGLKVKRI